MKSSKMIANRLFTVLGVVATAMLLAGCETQVPIYDTISGTAQTSKSPIFQVGDEVTIVFSPADRLQPHTEAVKEDGTITPPDVGAVTALGKQPGELQNELQKKYEFFYKNLTVTVLPKERYFYVSGEVRKPGAAQYLGVTDLISAISSAGDCTEFAKKKKIRLTRANGKMEIIDYEKAIQDPRYNVPVYPGDKIHVPRKLW